MCRTASAVAVRTVGASATRTRQTLVPVASWDSVFQWLDRLIHGYRKVALKPLRKAAMNTAARWITERQENNGCWGGIQPPAVHTVIALHLLGFDLDRPALKSGLGSVGSARAEMAWRPPGT